MGVWSALESAAARIGADPVGTGLAALSLLVAVLSAYYARIPAIDAWRMKRRGLADGGFAYLDVDEVRDKVRDYVQPDCCTVDPCGEDDLLAVIPARASVYRLFDEIFRGPTKYRIVLVLADSGMGKTSLLYKLMIRNLAKFSSRRLPILYIPLGIKNPRIELPAVGHSKAETILLLDAFDEDHYAVDARRDRLLFILERTREYKKVIITCRTQFFIQDDEIPRSSGLIDYGPRPGGASGSHLIYKVYLAPFTTRQIDAWLDQHYGWFKFRQKARARNIIHEIPELSARPMLLAVVPELVATREKVRSIIDIYRYMLEAWVERESEWIDRRTLHTFSKRLAVDIYCNRERRSGERLAPADLAQYAGLVSANNSWKLRGRSLINRDGSGSLKFAHRTFMEFFFVDAALEGERACWEVRWTDMMIKFAWGRIYERLDSNEAGQVSLGIPQFGSPAAVTTGLYKDGKVYGVIQHWLRLERRHSRQRAHEYAALFVRPLLLDAGIVVLDCLRDEVHVFTELPIQEVPSAIARDLQLARAPQVQLAMAGKASELMSLPSVREMHVRTTGQSADAGASPLWLCRKDVDLDLVTLEISRDTVTVHNEMLSDIARESRRRIFRIECDVETLSAAVLEQAWSG